MKIMMVLLLILVACIAVQLGRQNAAVKEAAEIAYNAERTKEQDRILVELQALNDPHVSQFVNDWRQYAPEPLPAQLSELRIIQANIKNDKSVAASYTQERREQEGKCGAVFEAAVTKRTFYSCKPGLLATLPEGGP